MQCTLDTVVVVDKRCAKAEATSINLLNLQDRQTTEQKERTNFWSQSVSIKKSRNFSLFFFMCAQHTVYVHSRMIMNMMVIFCIYCWFRQNILCFLQDWIDKSHVFYWKVWISIKYCSTRVSSKNCEALGKYPLFKNVLFFFFKFSYYYWAEGVSSTLKKSQNSKRYPFANVKSFDIWCEKCFAILLGQIQSKIFYKLVTYILAST